MPITILPAVPSDVNTIVDIYFSAFQNPMALHTFPDVPTVRAWVTAEFTKELSDPTAAWLLAFDAPPTDRSAAIALAKWVRPASHTGAAPPTSTPELPTWPVGADAALADDFFGKLARAHGAAMGDRSHWYLEMLAARAEAQGRGAGAALLGWGCAEADREGLEVYLESSPVGLRLYERFGFGQVGRVEVEWEEDGRGGGVEKCRFWNAVMVRQLKSES